MLGKFVCDLDCANYMLANSQKLMIAMLLDGEKWRTHKKQIFHYDDGAWIMQPTLVIKAWEHLLAVEGLFIQLALNLEESGQGVAWTWADAQTPIMDIIQHVVHAGTGILSHFAKVAKDNSDHLRATTSNKTWHATWPRRCADMLAQLRKAWEDERPLTVLSKLFLTEWDTPMPPSRGTCFDDVYLDDTWTEVPKSPQANCYLKIDYKFHYELFNADLDIVAIRETLRTFIESVYYGNQHLFQLKLCFMHAAFLSKCTAKMIFEIGKGGDGKGMEAILDRSLFGSLASATLDCGVFLERMEFRKSAELAWNKANIRVQEMESRGHFVADVWKRFVVDEEIDCRVNYGFTSKRCFGAALKVQELNLENIPVIEESRDRSKSCEQLRRRVVCFMMGKASFTTKAEEVNHDQGIFRYIPQDELVPFLSHPVTAAIYLRDWCIPFFRDNPIQDCLNMINDLASVHPDVERDTQWLALCLSGSSAPPPGGVVDLVSESNVRVVDVHNDTPWRRIIKEYLIQKVDALPGHAASSKGKCTKISYFIEAVDNATIRLFKQVESNSFHKLLVHWPRLLCIMEELGGVPIFGEWSMWSCPFDLLQRQEKWDGAAFDQDRRLLMNLRTSPMADASVWRPTASWLQERVDWTSLQSYVELGTDRRMESLDKYIARHQLSGVRDSCFSTVPTEKKKLPHYGRLMVRGPGGQKPTKEARRAAFDSHCAEIDAPCCHPRLLVLKLKTWQLWDSDKFPILKIFVEHYQAWRTCIAKYMDVDVDVAKTELTRIFYGGKPTVELPFLLKLADEIQIAAKILLSHEGAAEFSELYPDRRNPEFSRLSSLLSNEEAMLLDKVGTIVGDRMNMLLFDGAYITCDDMEAEILILEACQLCADTAIPLTVRSWPTRMPLMLPRRALRDNLSTVKNDVSMVLDYRNCLINTIATLCPDCDVSAFQDQDEPLSARVFNATRLFDSQRPSGEGYRLVHICKEDILATRPSDSSLVWFGHHPLQEGHGHWFGATQQKDVVTLIDTTAGRRHLELDIAAWQSLVESDMMTTWFILKLVSHDSPQEVGHAYELTGSSMETSMDFIEITTPLTCCAECQAPLARRDYVSARLYTLGGMKEVTCVSKRCSSKSCRVTHHYNFRSVETHKYHTLALEDMEYIFINSKVGFTIDFLDYHAALQFRGPLSNNAIEYAQMESLWEDPQQHYRWHREYADAQLYYMVLQEASNMWSSLQKVPYLQKMRSIDLQNPLTQEFLLSYRSWWHEVAVTKKEWQRVQEIVIDGHQKVAAKCIGNPPAHTGRPRKDREPPSRQNGWFMAVDPKSSLVLAVTNMETQKTMRWPRRS